ncbi:MAG TPA: hypothetical protein VKV37_15590 [Ktedonobacteraceae bacterium]|jgi:hypothetical protein|nr:hypothetical protein [Ktedonobacteraceae bacterium]
MDFPRSVIFDEYEMRLDPDRPGMIEITSVLTGDVLRLTIHEAVAILKLMHKYREEIRMLRTGEM